MNPLFCLGKVVNFSEQSGDKTIQIICTFFYCGRASLHTPCYYDRPPCDKGSSIFPEKLLSDHITPRPPNFKKNIKNNNNGHHQSMPNK
jgi:hypothetical protein